MLTPEQQKSVALTVTNLRIILLSLVASVSAFLIFIVTQSLRREDDSSTRFIGLAAAAGAVVAAVVVPMLMPRQQGVPASSKISDDVDPAAPLLAGLQARSIVRAAILEGVAFLNAFAYMQGRHPESLAVTIALLLGILVTIPFRGQTEEWLERELRLQRDAKDLRA